MKIDGHTIESLKCFYAPKLGVKAIESYIHKRISSPIYDRDKNTQQHLEQHAEGWHFSYKKLADYCKEHGILMDMCPNERAYEFSGENTFLILNKCHAFWQGHNTIYL